MNFPDNQKGFAHLLLIGILGVILFLILTSLLPIKDFKLSSLFPKQFGFAAGDGIIPGVMTLSPTFQSIAVEVNFTDDDNKNATANLEFKKSSDTVWRKGIDLWRVDGNDDSTPIDTLGRAFYGSALLLEHNTPYDIKVTINDPDGGGSVIEQTVTTRNDNIPTAQDLWNNTPASLKYYVRSNGSDSNDGKSEATAFKTLQKAVQNSVPAGAVVQVGPGYFNQATTQRVSQITFVAQYPAVDDNRNVINQGQHTVVEPAGSTTGPSAVSCPVTANDCTFKGVWQRVSGLTAPGLAGDNIATGSAIPESVDPNIQIWKWTGAPITNTLTLAYSTTREAEPQRVGGWTIPSTASISNPEGFVEKLITNNTYRYGFVVLNNGADVYLRLPEHAPSKDPNQLYITLGSASNGLALDIRGNGSRVSGIEFRGFQHAVVFTPSAVGMVADHNYMVTNRGGIYFQAFSPGNYGKDSVVQYNLIKDSGTWTDDTVNKPAIPWRFIKEGYIYNADGTQYLMPKPGQTSEGSGIGGRGGAMNTVIRYNTIDGPFNGITPGYQLGYNRYAGYNLDAHDNVIQHLADDAFEPEDQVINFKAWNNRINEALVFLSTGPVTHGPLYAFRNTAFRVGNAGVGVTLNSITTSGTFFKYSGSSVPIAKAYVINNTFWTDIGATAGGGQYASGASASEYFYMRNNIFRAGTYYSFDIAPQSKDGAKSWNEDYNYFSDSDPTRTFKYNGSVSGLNTITAYRTTTGQGSHTNIGDTLGTFATPVDPWLTNPTAGNLTLNTGTAEGKLIDMGTTVPNITETYVGCAPDLGAVESNFAGASPCPSATPIPTPIPTLSPLPSQTPVPTPTPSPTAAPIGSPDSSGTYRIDSASITTRTDSSGKSWIADGGYIGGGTTDRGAISISNTNDPWIYQTERYNVQGYSVNVPNGNYKIRMHFAETYSGVTTTGQRLFSVSVEGGNQINNLDIFTEAGKNAALIKEVDIAVTDGQLNINFTKGASVNGALINGLEIIPQIIKAGDINGDNKVDIFDYNQLLTDYGKQQLGLKADLDNNGKVDIFDYNILLSNYGT